MPNTWKLITSIFAEETLSHLDLLAVGAKHCLLVGKSVEHITMKEFDNGLDRLSQGI